MAELLDIKQKQTILIITEKPSQRRVARNVLVHFLLILLYFLVMGKNILNGTFLYNFQV